MAVLPIVEYPDERLRKSTLPVAELTRELEKIIDDMIETMYASKGIGLAANQVGLPWSIAVIDEEAHQEPKQPQTPRLAVYINPKIVSAEGKIDSQEGCLSIPGHRDTISRAEKVVVSYLDRHGVPQTLHAEGLLAIVLQHEIDHLNGKLYIDRLSAVKRNLFKKKYRRS